MRIVDIGLFFQFVYCASNSQNLQHLQWSSMNYEIAIVLWRCILNVGSKCSQVLLWKIISLSKRGLGIHTCNSIEDLYTVTALSVERKVLAKQSAIKNCTRKHKMHALPGSCWSFLQNRGMIHVLWYRTLMAHTPLISTKFCYGTNSYKQRKSKNGLSCLTLTWL